MKHLFERKMMMNRVAFSGLICCLLGTIGCVSHTTYNGAQCENGVCTSNQEFTAVCYENADGYSECSEGGSVNYTRTAADFREYGERTPRDHRITQSGAGNNISAVVPPSINDEVVEYENVVTGNNSVVQPAVPAAPAAPTANVASAAPSGYTTQIVNGQPVQVPVAPNVAPNAVPQAMAMQNQAIPEAPAINDTESDEGSSTHDWLAEEGQSLKELLTQWSDEAGWRLIWKTNRNYTLNAGAMFRGNFADVSSALIRAFARARPAPIATFYKGNRVLVIETMEDENAYD